jgi:hypothetical protein
VAARAVDDARQAFDVVQALRAINDETRTILREARAVKANGLALQAIARLERQIEVQARLLGQLQDGPTVNLIVSQEWLTVRGALLEALAPYPEARAAVAARLVALEASHGPR